MDRKNFILGTACIVGAFVLFFLSKPEPVPVAAKPVPAAVAPAAPALSPSSPAPRVGSGPEGRL